MSSGVEDVEMADEADYDAAPESTEIRPVILETTKEHYLLSPSASSSVHEPRYDIVLIMEVEEVEDELSVPLPEEPTESVTETTTEAAALPIEDVQMIVEVVPIPENPHVVAAATPPAKPEKLLKPSSRELSPLEEGQVTPSSYATDLPTKNIVLDKASDTGTAEVVTAPTGIPADPPTDPSIPEPTTDLPVATTPGSALATFGTDAPPVTQENQLLVPVEKSSPESPPPESVLQNAEEPAPSRAPLIDDPSKPPLMQVLQRNLGKDMFRFTSDGVSIIDGGDGMETEWLIQVQCWKWSMKRV